MSRLRILLAVLLVVCAAVICAEESPKLHICTLATDKTKGLQQLLDSCSRNHLSVDILGMGERFLGFGYRLNRYEDYLQGLPDSDIVLFIDAYDVLILAAEGEILNTFYSLDAPFIISAERYCFPLGHLEYLFPRGPTSFRYINAGSYIGYVGEIKKLFEHLRGGNPLFPNRCDDQGLFSEDYLSDPENYCLDVFCKLFMPFPGMIEGDFEINQKTSRVKCLETQSYPCLIHGAGGSRPLYQLVYDKLFTDNPYFP